MPRWVKSRPDSNRGVHDILKLQAAVVGFLASLCFGALSGAETLVTTFNFEEGDFGFTHKEGGGETFDYIELPNALHLNKPAAPMLPLVAAAFAVPWAATVNSITVTASNALLLDGEYYVYPTQAPAPMGAEVWTPPDAAIYGADEPYPATIVEGRGQATSRGHLLYYFTLAPMQYYPADRKIKLYTSVEITLDYTPPATPPAPTRMEHDDIYDMWSAAVAKMVVNPADVAAFREPVTFVDVNRVTEMEYDGQNIQVVEEADSQYYQYSAPPADDLTSMPYEMVYPYPYVVVTNNYWQHDGSREYIGDLVKELVGPGWPPYNKEALGRLKTRKGYAVAVRTVDDIAAAYENEGMDTQAKIQRFLNDAYEKWGTGYALFAGDVEQPPGGTRPVVWRRHGRFGVVPVRYLCPDPNAHLDPSPENPHPENYIFNLDYTAGDLYYACVDDWDLTHWDGNGNGIHGQKRPDEMMTFAPELAVGRVALGVEGAPPAESERQARDYQAKLYKYETDPFGGLVPPGTYTYFKKALLLGAEGWWAHCNTIKTYLQGFQQFDELYEEGYPNVIKYPRYPETCDVIAKMNESHGITYVYCHGHPFCFYHLTHGADSTLYPYLQTTPARKEYIIPYHARMVFPAGFGDLTNRPGVLYTVSCDVNRYDYKWDAQEDCLGETYTLLAEHGGVAFLGNHRHGITGISDRLAESFFDQLFRYNTPTPNDGTPQAGLAEVLSKRIYAHSGANESERFIAFTHDLAGEPEFAIYTDDPHVFAVTYEAITIEEYYDYLVHVTVRDASSPGTPPVARARVCLWVHDQGLHLVGETNDQGEIYFHTNRASSAGCTWLTVSRTYATFPSFPFIVHVSEHSIPGD